MGIISVITAAFSAVTTLTASLIRDIPWSSPAALWCLFFIGGCEFNQRFMVHPQAAVAEGGAIVQPRRVLFPRLHGSGSSAAWVVEDCTVSEPAKSEPTPDPISTDDVAPKPLAILPPKMAEALERLIEEGGGDSGVNPKASSGGCGPGGCGVRRRGLFGGWR